MVAFKTNEKKCFKCNDTGHLAKACKAKGRNQETKCFKCNGRGHIAKFCRKKENSSGTTKCSICKKSNHVEKDYYFRKNKIEDQANTKDNNKDNKISFLASSSTTSEWILDSGSSSYMPNNKNLFKNLQPIKTEIGTAKKTQTLKAEGIGMIETDKFILIEVLYVPELTKNLLSVNAIIENGGTVLFTKGRLKLKTIM